MTRRVTVGQRRRTRPEQSHPAARVADQAVVPVVPVVPAPGIGPPADRTLAWQAMERWRSALWPTLQPHVGGFRGEPVRPEMRLPARARATFVRRLRRATTIKALAAVLPRHYDAVRLFHGCRPTDVTSYYARGLEPLDCAVADALALSVYGDGAFPEVTADEVRCAIADVGSDLRQGRVYFCFDARELVERCGHYLIYGSEYLCSVGASLIRQRRLRDGWATDYRQALTRRGTPTLFACDLPWALVPAFVRSEIAGALVEGVAAAQGTPETALRVPSRVPIDGSGFWVPARVPPTCLAGHVHPARIPDWIARGGADYVR